MGMDNLLKIKKFVGCFYRPTRAYIKYGTERRKMRYTRYYKTLPLDQKMILYESFFGRGMLDNPYAIFLYLIKQDPEVASYTHVWVLDNMEKHKDLISEWASYTNVIFVNKNSRSYLKYLCQAKYLINNTTFPTYFLKKAGQVYINTWHGIPLKTLGYDMPNGKTEVSNTIRNFLHTDYLISTSPALTDCYRDAYKLKNVYKGTIIEEGYPRLDLQKAFSKAEIIKKLESKGVSVDPNKQIILYAPTWRGVSYAEADNDVKGYFELKQRLEEGIDLSKYQILIRPHQRVYELAEGHLVKGVCVPATLDSNEILSITDILISDYSSIFFDFLATGKPILFYINDLQEYTQNRGLYRTPDQLPGPYSDSVIDLIAWINNIKEIQTKYRKRYVDDVAYSGSREVGNITKKVVDIVFHNKTDGYRLISLSTQKKKIMLSRGRMIPNGITNSFLNLLNGIDYSDYDISVMVTNDIDPKELEHIYKINSNVRVFYRNSSHDMTFMEKIHHEWIMRFGSRKRYYEMYLREWKRCYGDADFDYIIDYEGYNLYFALLSLQAKNAVHIMWLHSDMMAEYNMRFPFLLNIFKLYRYFDRIVACGKEVMDTNMEKLTPAFIDKGQLTYVRNMVGIARIQEGLMQKELYEHEGKMFIQTSISESTINENQSIPLIPYFPATKEGHHTYRFVTIGRLSPEKNHHNMIEAFVRFQKENVASYLYILGEGPLRSEIEAQIHKLRLEEHIILTGVVENPFAILKNCDCFILPSLHEGQPMVINEARALHMPIIISDFATADGVMIENGQLLIGHTEDDIYQGFTTFAQGDVPHNYEFDLETYNKDAYSEFKQALGDL